MKTTLAIRAFCTAFLLLMLNPPDTRAQRTVRYDLYVGDTLVNYTGTPVHAVSINGSIPAPELHFTEGDTADIYVHNTLHEETSVHWHGLILPNEQDGVPYLTTAPIPAGTTAHYRFPLVQNGTYWYHSHTGLQEQSGMYGAFIIHKREPEEIPEYVVLLSDWTNEMPMEVERSLHIASDWYAIRKRSTQNYFDAVKEGHLGTKLMNEWKRMTAMDVSDVYYDRFLVNGKPEMQAPRFRKGDRVKLRIINGSSSTYFWLHYAGGKLKVVATDGQDVVPVEVDRMIIAVSETYDVEVTIPEEGTAFEFLATSEDRSNKTSLWLGSGTRQLAVPLERLKYFEGMKMMNDMMTVGGNMKDMGMQMHDQIMDMNTVMYPEVTGPGHRRKHKDTVKVIPPVTLNYTMLRAPQNTVLPSAPVREFRFELTGNMNRYVWTINNKTVSEADKIWIRKGENIRLVIYNNSMMRHPMHLHGHFFRVLNGQGEYSPLKTVLDIMPMETDTIEFAATESGDWYFHCHILYHMMSGMGRVFSYEDSPPNTQFANPKKALRKLYKDDRAFHTMMEIGFESNGSDGEIMVGNTRWFFQAEWRLGFNLEHGLETESHFGRYLDRNQFLRLYAGWDMRYRMPSEHMDNDVEYNLFRQPNTKDNRLVACLGVQYVLPLLILADFRVDHTGYVRLQLSREDIPLTSRLRLNLMFNTDFEYMVGLRYITTRYFSFSTHYDSDMGFGAGFTFNY